MKPAALDVLTDAMPAPKLHTMAFDTILVATDFGDTAQMALDWAIELARALGARIVLVHAFDLPLVGLPDAALMVTAEVAARLTNEAQAALDAEVARASGKGVQLTGVLRQGDPRELVPEFAISAKASLIVVGSHGRRGLARTLLGSIAEDILRTSKTPVAVVRLRP
jgi:nucleotide-binding universal stress UspA family protein